MGNRVMIKKLTSAPVRPEKEPRAEVEIWQPDWKCFCCHDSGVVAPHLASLVIEDYNRDRDKLPRCVAPGCESGSQYDLDTLQDTIDYRIDAATCQQLDSLEREDWRKTVQAKAQRIQDAAKTLAKEKSIRVRDRSPDENRVIADRHRLVTEEDWGLVAGNSAEKKWLDGWEGEG